MSDEERLRVGEVLDLVRDTLAPYVDHAMTTALGQDWDRVVAREEALRRNGKTFPVAKRDLAVLLKIIVHRRIDPWRTLPSNARVRAYASELLSLRNLHAHGDDCLGEHARLVDTAQRLLTTLGLAVPTALTQRTLAKGRQTLAGLPIDAFQAPRISLSDAELETLGESGERVSGFLVKTVELSQQFHAQIRQATLSLDPALPDFEEFSRKIQIVVESTGIEGFRLLGEANRMSSEPTSAPNSLLSFLILWARAELLSGAMGKAVSHTAYMMLELDGSDRDEDRIAEVEQILGNPQDDWALWQDVIQRASCLPDSSTLANLGIASANVRLAESLEDDTDNRGWGEEALQRVRDAIDRLRFLTSREPGSSVETALVATLRREGQICNDLGRTEEALRAFARADEVVDRYPTSDPVFANPSKSRRTR